MGNGKTLKEQMEYVRAENKAQTASIKSLDGKIDQVITKLSDHEKSSALYREQQAKNTVCINGIKKESLPPLRKAIYALYGLAGAGLITLIATLIRELIKRNL